MRAANTDERPRMERVGDPRSRRTASLVVVCAVVVAGAAVGGQERGSEPTLADLAWMTGYWVGTNEGVTAEEVWLEPRGAFMIGLHRDTSAQGNAFFEYLRIQRTPDGIMYLASPAGREPTPFLLTSLEQQRVTFENPEHDFPQRISYWLDDDGTLHARVESSVDGETETTEWAWRRATLP